MIRRCIGPALPRQFHDRWSSVNLFMSTSLPTAPTPSVPRSFVETLLILVATTLVAVAVLQAEPLQSANDRSRWATVWSLVERGTWQIDEIDAWPRWSTIDKVRSRTSPQEPWHFYSSKPPFLSTIVAGLYAVVRSLTGYGLFNHTAFVTRLLLLIVNVVPFCLTLFCLQRTLQQLGTALTTRTFVLLTAGFGSLLNPYLTTLNNHTPAVACAMLTISAALRLSLQPRRRDFVALGFFAAMTSCFELPAAQLGVAALAIATGVSLRQTLRWFVPAAIIPLLFFFATNWSATGGLKPFYATYGTETYVYVHRGIPSYWSNPQDLDANTESPLVYLFHCTLGHHGLLSLTPVLLLSLAGPVFVKRFRSQARSPLDTEAQPAPPDSLLSARKGISRLIILGGGMTLITLGFYLSRTENYNYGGNSFGLRWMLWLTPFWWLAMVPLLEVSGRRMLTFAAVLLLLSSGTVAWSLNRPWKPSWVYERMEAAGWIQYRTPRPPFDPPRFSVLLPQPGTTPSDTFVNSRGDRVTVKAVTTSGSKSTTVTVPMAILDGVQILPGKFGADGLSLPTPGLPPASRLNIERATDQQRITYRLQQIFGTLRSGRPFLSGGTTWIPSVRQPDTALKVERGAIRVAFDVPGFGPCIERVDVLFCDQRPLGVLQWKVTLTDADTGDTLRAETWMCSDY